MKKAIDQTIRDLKREVNKKVLKVPGIEQKVLDATSNEPWGPHGSHLADIAQATRNYHEYQMIMAVLWKRINDTGKNWRHVYKALTVLEYLVAHGSERVIDEIREHAYQISTLSDFQYIDSSGRDQGSNVRRKSQSLVTLVNDKERIQEARQKAASNRDKYRNTSSTGGMYRPGSYSSTGGYGDRYDDDRYEGRYGYRDDERNGYGREREREWGYREDDRYGRGGDSYGRDGDHYGRDSDDRYGRDGQRDDDFRGRSRSTDDYQYGSRARSSDAYRDRMSDDDGHYSSRSSGARADDHSQGERRLERKFSEQNIGGPPSYEEAVNDTRSPVQNERDGVAGDAPAPKASSPTGSANQDSVAHSPSAPAPATNQQYDGFDEFDPRGSVPVAPPTASNGEMDLLGSLSESFSSHSLALVPVTANSTPTEVDAPVTSGPGSTFVALSSASTVLNQPFEDPFGDSPFKATLSDNVQVQQQYTASTSNFQPTAAIHGSEPPPQHPYLSEAPQQTAPQMQTVSSFEFGDTFPGITYTPSTVSHVQAPANPQFSPPEPSLVNQNTDILANILPPSGPAGSVASQAAFVPQTGSPALPSGNTPANLLPPSGSAGPVASQAAFLPPTGSPALPSGNIPANLLPPSGPAGWVASQAAFPPPTGSPALPSGNIPAHLLPQSGGAAPTTLQGTLQAPVVSLVQQQSDVLGNMLPQTGTTIPVSLQTTQASTGTSTSVQPPKDKFETKSAVWADTLNRGLVNLNISGPKINPLADIGIDFDSINRKEKREKPVQSTSTSTITMGKAMGSGSGIGRAGASALGPPPNPMISSGMGMGMSGGGMNQPMGMGGGGMNHQPMGMGMGMGMGVGYGGGMNQPMGMGMGSNMGMGMGQGMQMRPPTGLPQGPAMPGSYNAMMGASGYPQHPYGGYR